MSYNDYLSLLKQVNFVGGAGIWDIVVLDSE